MRILHVLDHSAPLHSGYTFRTLSIMREQRKRGWEPVLLTGPKQGSGDLLEEDADDWHFFRTPDPGSRATQWPVVREIMQIRALEQRLQAVARQTRPDIIHAHSSVLNGLPALRVARRLGMPLVYEVRAFWEDAAVEHGTSRAGSVRYRATRAAESFVLRRADAVTTICQGLRDDIVERGVAANRVTVVANAVDAEQFTTELPADTALRDALDLEGCRVLGFAGSFYSYEGLDLLIGALPLLQAGKHRVKLLLVGGGPEEANLKALAAKLGVAHSIVFVGRVPHADMPRYYELMDMLVYPRVRQRLTELVTPLKPLEAMARGKLVAASDVGGHRELIADEETGFLFAPDSSMALAERITVVLETATARLNDMRATARRFVERERTWKRSVSCYEDIYARLAAETVSRESRENARS